MAGQLDPKSRRSAHGAQAGELPVDKPRRSWAPLALRYLRGYPLRSHPLTLDGRQVLLASPMNPEALLAERRIEQRFDQDDYMPFWSDLWPSSVGLADYLLATNLGPKHSNGLAVEIGCGLALAGIAAGLLGWQVLFTDYDADALTFATFNAKVNGLRHFAAMLLDWRKPPAHLQADLVLAADTLYEHRLHAPLLDCIDTILSQTGIAIIADSQRDAAKGFGPAAEAAGWDLHLQRWADGPNPDKCLPIDVYMLTRRR